MITTRTMLQTLLWVALLLPVHLQAQNTIVRGTVTDAATDEPLPFVAIAFTGSNVGTTTDIKGKFFLESIKEYDHITVSYLGYASYDADILAGEEQQLKIALMENAVDLEEVVVTSGKRDYRNKENPAVGLIKKVIDHKDDNRMEDYDFYEFEQYEKIQFAISNVTADYQSKRVFKNFQFVFDNLDTTHLGGKAILPVYLKENLANVYYRKEPKSRKEEVSPSKAVSFEGFDNSMIDQYLQYVYQDIDIYDNDITLLTSQFLSPTSPLSPTFYRFYLGDTLLLDDITCSELFFYPRNKSDLLFQGTLYIALDGSYAIKRAEMTVTDDINLNWVREMSIDVQYERREGVGYLLSDSEFSADFSVTEKSRRGIFARRTLSRQHYEIGRSREDDFYAGEPFSTVDSAATRSDDFWNEKRHDDLSKVEEGTYAVMDSIQEVPAFKRARDLLILLISGYVDLGTVELGPINSFYSFNPVEGSRLRFGGRTTDLFSKLVLLDGFVTYGTRDERFKYSLGSTISLNGKSLSDFPMKSLHVEYRKDTQIPGQTSQFLSDDNLLLSFTRGPNDKLLYNEIFGLSYLNEFENHFSFQLGANRWEQSAGGSLRFNTLTEEGGQMPVKSLTSTEVTLTLRWAPREQFYQMRGYRIRIDNKYPVFTLRSINGVNGLLGGQYDYQKVTGHVFKRFSTAQIGYSDVALEAGKVFGTVPYPFLTIHNANQTYSYQLQAYNLMNFLEFVSDQYASVNIDHNFNGAIFNKVPGLKKLKWREVATIKVLFGSISDRNLPVNNSGVLEFPKNENGQTITGSLEATPYIEGSLGIANIFKIFRVDLVKRFTYLDNPNIAEYGVRTRFKLDF